ncbi:MAG: glycosyltransferase [Roseiflexaceae bacterium]
MLHPTWDRLLVKQQVIAGIPTLYAAQMHAYGMPGARRYYRPMTLIGVSLRAALALAHAALRFRPDLVHVAKPQPINGLAGLLVARLRRIPMFVDCDDYEAGANRVGAAWQRQLISFWEDHLPRHASGVTVNTRFLADRVRRLGVAAERIAYVPNGIDRTQIARPPQQQINALRQALGLSNHPTLAYLGTISEVAHGVGLLLEAFRIACADLPQARLLIIGDGDDRRMLMQRANDLGLATHVRWLGRVAPTAANQFLTLAQASVDPVRETPAMAARSPLKIVESMAAGVPVLTSAVGDRRELLGSTGGMLVDADSATALAHGIVAILSSNQTRHISRIQAQAARFCWDQVVRPWIDLLGSTKNL